MLFVLGNIAVMALLFVFLFCCAAAVLALGLGLGWCAFNIAEVANKIK